ncbi:hypothetical protein [Labrys wisconsinensis]|uniref:Uncharacterized protein n=1 Tax=Labrys wisconsinensis TaxID=425677 RepID=A0ABU0JKK1_9HYPH|nr:hypothetical protein [Labrys wisconsinensis]MDQ0474821.1 hypothetical protein [Labrys wisconsinensis]
MARIGGGVVAAGDRLLLRGEGRAPSRTELRHLGATVLPICPTDCGSASYISAPP